MYNEYVFVVLTLCGPIASHNSYASNIFSVSYPEEAAWESIEKKINSDVLNVSYSEEAAWAAIERDINDRIAKNKFGNPYISIYPESRLIRVTLPIHCGCDDIDIIYKYYDYRIIRKPITD